MKTNNKKKHTFSLVFELLFILLQLPYTIGKFIYLIFKPIVYLITTIISVFHQSILFLIHVVETLISIIVVSLTKGAHFISLLCKKIIFTTLQVISFTKNVFLSIGSGIVQLIRVFPYQQFAAITLFLTSIAVVAAITFFGLLHIEQQPYPTNVSDFTVQQPIRIYDVNHYPLYEAYTKPSTNFIAPSQIPSTLATSIIALNDPSFYSHPGVTLGFIWDYCKEKLFLIPTEERLSITQQLAANALGRSAQSLPQEIQELILSFQLEKKYTKDELLAMYLTIQPFGLEVGAEQAAARLFNTPLHDLSDQQSLFLASILGVDPLQINDIDAAIQDKYSGTLSTLHGKQIISDSWYESNKFPPVYSPELRKSNVNAVRLVFNEGTSKLPDGYNIKNGVHIQSTIDLSYQNAIQRIVIENFSGSEVKVPQATLALVDAKTGSLKAITGYSSSIDSLEGLIEASHTAQELANPNLTHTIHSVESITSSEGFSLPLTDKVNNPTMNKVQAQEPIASAFANNTSIAGWVIDAQTAHPSTEESEKIVDAIADYLLKQSKENKKSSN